jgi:hypothetical protein
MNLSWLGLPDIHPTPKKDYSEWEAEYLKRWARLFQWLEEKEYEKNMDSVDHKSQGRPRR